MKIGILTYHRAHNYGAVLQAYALKTFLSNQGHVVEFIDYWPEYRKGMYDLAEFSFIRNNELKLLQKIKRIIKLVLVYPEKKVRYKKFQLFIKHYLGISGNVKFKTGEEINGIYDTIIYGSDQIWRYNSFQTFTGFDPVYWGSCPQRTNAKKIAFAASMGVIMNSMQHEIFIKEHLKNFHLITVRENSLKGLIQIHTNKPVTHILDPVFLLNADDWIKISSHRKMPRQDYVLFYHLNYSKKAIELTKRIAKKYKYKIIEIKGDVSPLRNPYKCKQKVGPTDFINLFTNASFIVSTSFHGVAFSIIFEKQFYAMGLKSNSARVKELLNLIGIPERYIDDINFHNHENIHYRKLTPIVQDQIQISQNILKKNMRQFKHTKFNS